jgi:hypothetical protein
VSLLCFENKVPSFTHFDIKDGKNLRVDIFCVLLFMRKLIEKSLNCKGILFFKTSKWAVSIC